MGLFGSKAKTLGEVAVPGSGALDLPAGKVKLRYVEDREGRSTGEGSTNWRGPDKSRAVTVTVNGQTVEVKPTRFISEGAGGGKIYKEYGSIELPAPSRCEILAETQIGDDHRNPRIALRG